MVHSLAEKLKLQQDRIMMMMWLTNVLELELVNLMMTKMMLTMMMMLMMWITKALEPGLELEKLILLKIVLVMR
jgi:hypothetical protein